MFPFRNLQIKLKQKTSKLCTIKPVIQGLQKWWIEKSKPISRMKTIQYDALCGVFDCFYTSEEAWIFNPTFLKSLAFYSNMAE